MNDTCEKAWGAALAQCQGKLDHDIWPRRVAARLRASDAAVLCSGQASRTLEEISLENGRTLQMLSFRFPFLDARGRRLLGGVSVDISEQVRAEKALAAALDAKEVLLMELNHRVKNNLQVISSLLTMQEDSISDPAAQHALQESQKRVQSIALIHERLNREENLDQVNFGEYAESLTRELFCSYGAISGNVGLRFELAQVFLGLSQAIPLGLILNEL